MERTTGNEADIYGEDADLSLCGCNGLIDLKGMTHGLCCELLTRRVSIVALLRSLRRRHRLDRRFARFGHTHPPDRHIQRPATMHLRPSASRDELGRSRTKPVARTDALRALTLVLCALNRPQSAPSCPRFYHASDTP